MNMPVRGSAATKGKRRKIGNETEGDSLFTGKAKELGSSNWVWTLRTGKTEREKEGTKGKWERLTRRVIHRQDKLDYKDKNGQL